MNRTGLRKKDQQYETHQEIGIDIHAHLLLLDGLMGRSITKRTEGQKNENVSENQRFRQTQAI